MTWDLAIVSQVRRQLKRLPPHERAEIDAAFSAMCDDPFDGDVKFLRGLDRTLHRRVGDWRILYELHHSQKLIVVTALRRRGSHTY